MDAHPKLAAWSLILGIPIAVLCIAFPPLFVAVVLVLLLTGRDRRSS